MSEEIKDIEKHIAELSQKAKNAKPISALEQRYGNNPPAWVQELLDKKK